MKRLSIGFALATLVQAQPATAPAKDPELARYEKLAGEGDARAMTEVGLRYHQGRGVKQDYLLAYDWYIKAVAKD